MDRETSARTRLFGQNDRNLVATWDERVKLVANAKGRRMAVRLYDRSTDPRGDTRRVPPAALRTCGPTAGSWSCSWSGRSGVEPHREALAHTSGEERLSVPGCEQLKALGYVQGGCR